MIQPFLGSAELWYPLGMWSPHLCTWPSPLTAPPPPAPEHITIIALLLGIRERRGSRFRVWEPRHEQTEWCLTEGLWRAGMNPAPGHRPAWSPPLRTHPSTEQLSSSSQPPHSSPTAYPVFRGQTPAEGDDSSEREQVFWKQISSKRPLGVLPVVLTSGTKGGSSIPASNRLKFMLLKKGCLFTSAAPSP